MTPNDQRMLPISEEELAYIARMERVHNETEAALREAAAAVEKLERLRGAATELFDYYGSERWFAHRAADAQGTIPQDLPRGVLTEDAVYDLLGDYIRFYEQLHAIGGEVKRANGMEETTMRRYELNQKDHELIAEALKTLAANFDDGVYYHTVGCALLCKNGKVYTGVNCDGIHGSCAEYVTIGTAISQGEREFDTIVAVHEHAKNGVVPPCGNCRQMMFEYCPDILVIVNDENGKLIKVSARDLLPFAYEEIKADE